MASLLWRFVLKECAKKNVIVYSTESGDEPFSIWLANLDNAFKKKAVSRLERVSFGNYGDYKRLSEYLFELRFSSGLRIYFAEFEKDIVLLLSGGDKKNQSKDIKLATEYLEDYLMEVKNG